MTFPKVAKTYDWMKMRGSFDPYKFHSVTAGNLDEMEEINGFAEFFRD